MSTYTPFTHKQTVFRNMNSSSNNETDVAFFTMPKDGFIIPQRFDKIEGENILINCAVFAQVSRPDDLAENQFGGGPSISTEYFYAHNWVIFGIPDNNTR
jgi:hypothetical protein